MVGGSGSGGVKGAAGVSARHLLPHAHIQNTTCNGHFCMYHRRSTTRRCISYPEDVKGGKGGADGTACHVRRAGPRSLTHLACPTQSNSGAVPASAAFIHVAIHAVRPSQALRSVRGVAFRPWSRASILPCVAARRASALPVLIPLVIVRPLGALQGGREGQRVSTPQETMRGGGERCSGNHPPDSSIVFHKKDKCYTDTRDILGHTRCARLCYPNHFSSNTGLAHRSESSTRRRNSKLR